MPGFALNSLRAFARAAFGRHASIVASLVILPVVGTRVAAQRPLTVTAVAGVTTLDDVTWSGLEYVKLRVSLTVRNTTAAAQMAYGSVDDCGPFELSPGEGCPGVANAPSIAAGQTATLHVDLAYQPADGFVRVIVSSSAGGMPDAVVIHVKAAAGLVATLVEATYTPQASPKGTTVTLGALTNSATVSFVIQNAGTAAATYKLKQLCGAWTSVCTISDTAVSIAAGGSTSVSVGVRTGAVGTNGQVKLIATAPPRQSGIVQVDTASVTVVATDNVAPTIAFTPAGTSAAEGQPPEHWTFQRTIWVTVDACDPDGTIGVPSMMFNNNAIPYVAIQSISIAGCNSAKRATYSVLVQLLPGGNVATITVSDGVHTSTKTQTFYYDDSIDHKPGITVLHPTVTVPVNRPMVDTFRVTNPGWHAVTYNLGAWCHHENMAGCLATAGMPTVSVAPGGSVMVPVNYPSAATANRTTTVGLQVLYVGPRYAFTYTDSMRATTALVAPPTVVVTPPTGTTVTTDRVDVVAVWCDPDGAIASRTVTWQGQPLPDTYVAETRAGCVTAGRSTWSNLTVNPWQQAIVATVVDAEGHTTTATSNIYYDVPLAAYRPYVSPKSGWHVFPRNVPAADTFVVRNSGGYNATYTLTPFCGTLGACTTSLSSTTLAPGATATAIVSYVSPSTIGAGDTVRLVARYTSPAGTAIADTGKKFAVVPAIEAAPQVIPPNFPLVLAPGGFGSRIFGVRNPGSARATYRLTTTVAGAGWGWAAGWQPDTVVTVDPGQVGTVWISAVAPNVGGAAGTYTLTASYATTTGTTLSGTASAGASTSAGGAIGVSVSPHSMSVSRAGGAVATQVFDITMTGAGSSAFAYAIECAGAASCTRVDGNTQTLSASNRTQSVSITYATATTNGLTGLLKAVATSTGNGAVKDSGMVAITIRTAVPVAVAVDSVNPGTANSRGQCLAIAAGDAAAYECGDLRLFHALPATRTMNRAWAPTLIYNSRHANPVALVAANVTTDPGVCFTSLTGRVFFAERDTSATFAWPSCSAGGDVRRIVVPVNGRGLATRPYDYTFEVTGRKTDGTTVSASATGTLVVVNRESSPFGSGWWMDGLEQLVTVPGNPNQLLWVGGDGSTRLYLRASAASAIWRVSPTIDRADTLESGTFDGIAGYKRHLRNGAYVLFDAALRHVATVNVLKHRTRFVHSATLDQIVLPVPSNSSADRRYVFAYAGGMLSSVAAPPAGGISRTTTIARTTDGYSVADPDGRAVSYAVDARGRVVRRYSRRGDYTDFAYDEASALKQVAADMSRTSESAIVTTFCSSEAVSLAACASGPRDTAQVATVVNGPRANVNATQFQVTRFGAPRTIVNALGQITRIERTNASFPLLATAVVQPNGHRIEAVYNWRGLDSTITDLNPLGDGQNAIIRYAWHPVWDKVTSTSLPTGVVTTADYNAATGDLSWQQTGTTAARRVSFVYDPATRFVKEAISPSPLGTTRYRYDALGNADQVTTAIGFVTTTTRDAIGRDSIVVSPIDSLQTSWRRQTWVYDVMGRVIASTDSAPAAGVIGSVAQALHVASTYDEDGRLKSVSRWSNPDSAAVGAITTDYEYDGAGRKTAERDRFAPSGQATRWQYDAAGNVTQIGTRDQRSVTMEYDALNRMTVRRIPAVSNRYGSTEDVQQFAFDAAGNLSSATNAYARVERTYSPAGWLVSDTLRIKAADLSTTGWAHAYGLTNSYDVAGRRISQRQSANVASAAVGTIWYGYDAETGSLQTVTTGGANTFTYGYNAAGLLAQLTMPGNVVETHEYDADGREVRRREVGPQGTIHDDRVGLDAEGRRLAVAAAPTATGVNQTGLFKYGGLGAVLTSWLELTDLESTRYTTDAFGQTITKRQDGNETSPGAKNYKYQYEPHSNRLSKVTGVLAADVTDVLTHTYDAAGNLVAQSYGQTTPFKAGEGSTLPVHIDAAWSVGMTYDALGRLMVAERWTVNDNHIWNSDLTHARTPAAKNTGHGSYEEYRYDALGRRVWKRTHRKPYCTVEADLETTECLSAVQVTVWDGDQMLYEIRAPGQDALSPVQLESGIDNASAATLPTEHFGRVMYLHGPTIDRPLALIRESAILVLHTNWRGQVDLSTNLAGQYSTCGYPGATVQTGCADVTWPGQESGITFTRPYAMRGPRTWYGDLSQGSRDASGQMYMRNRYYDPNTGRFTQEDPIGLAGGMNLYGFAGGDPVNFSDPFGLCSMKDGWKDCEKMVGPATSQYMAQIAPLMGEWTYSQAPSGAGYGMDPKRAKPGEHLGDCTDLALRVTLFAVNAGSNIWRHQKTTTAAFRSGDHDGYTEVESDMVRPGDIVVQGSHAGVFQYFKGSAPMGWANNGSPHRKNGSGYRDRPTGITSFASGSFGTGDPRYFRPIVRR